MAFYVAYRSPLRNILFIFFLFSLLVACNGNSGDIDNVDNGTVTLNLIGEGLTPFYDIEKLAPNFTRETGIQVKIHPYEFETALSKTMFDFRSNTAQYDVVMGIYFNLGKYVELGEILPLEPLLEDTTLRDSEVQLENFFQPVLDVSCRYKGTLYGLPATAQTMYLWYRKDLYSHPGEKAAFLERFGYPLPLPDAEIHINWDQYRDLAEFFTRKAGDKLAGKVLEADFYGTTLQAKRHPAAWYEFANYLYSFGGHIIDPDTGEVVIDSPQALAAFEFYLSLLPWSPPGAPQYTWDDALSLFQQGRLAQVTEWFDSSPAIEDPNESLVAGKVGYSTVPENLLTGLTACQYGGWAFYINADTRHPRESFRLIQWLNRPDVQQKWATMGGLPSTLSTFESPDFLASQRRRAEQASLKLLTAWTRAPYSEEILTKGMEAVSSAANGQRSAQEALSWLAQEIKKIQARREEG